MFKNLIDGVVKMTLKEMDRLSGIVSKNITESEKDAGKVLEYSNKREKTCDDIRKSEVSIYKGVLAYERMK